MPATPSVQIAYHDEYGNHGGNRDEQPEHLIDGELWLEARYKRNAYAREHKRNRQDDWIRARGEEPNRHMCHGKGSK